MIVIKLTKDSPSAWSEGKTLPRGRVLHITDKKIAQFYIEKHKAVPVVENELVEIRKQKKSETL